MADNVWLRACWVSVPQGCQHHLLTVNDGASPLLDRTAVTPPSLTAETRTLIEETRSLIASTAGICADLRDTVEVSRRVSIESSRLLRRVNADLAESDEVWLCGRGPRGGAQG